MCFYVGLSKTFSVQFSSVTQSCPTLCDPMNRSTPGLPVHHQLPEFTQTHVHRVSDAIQPSHPLSSPSPPNPQSLPASESFPKHFQPVSIAVFCPPMSFGFIFSHIKFTLIYFPLRSDQSLSRVRLFATP